ncbi:hypothetical protein DMUE_6079, partial [Dictyocoela muelleri]
KGEDILLMFDETTDVNGRFVLNILGGFCSKISRQKIFLLRTIGLSKTNNVTVGQEIINIMFEIYEGDINYNKLLIYISDAAPYAVKTVECLKHLFPNLKHVTCLAHMFYRLCKKLREISSISNYVSSELKRILVKNKDYQPILKEIPGLKLPKLLIITRWEQG